MGEDTLTIDERLKVLRQQRTRYHSAGKAEKGQILDMLEQVTGLNRKTLIRRLRGLCVRRARSHQRGAHYGPEVDDVLRLLARAYDGLCAERLTPNLLPYAQKLAAHGHLTLTSDLQTQLAQISVSSVRRRLQRLGQDEPSLRRLPPRPRNPLLAAVPTRRISGFETQPGHLEVDLVHHSGPSPSGDYLHTLHLVDVATGWSEMAAILGRSYRAMQEGLLRCERRLPFRVLEIHPDNGSEFFNAHLYRFYQELFCGVHLSRSRPWHKDDNRFVEQRNGALIRRWLGHERLDTVAQTRLLNQFYDRLWLYHNFFQPVMRLVGKSTHPQTGRVQRHWDTPRTPFQRLVASGCLGTTTLPQLTALYEATDPLALRQQLEQDLDALWRLPGARPGQRENVLDTLELSLNSPIGKEDALPLGDIII